MRKLILMTSAAVIAPMSAIAQTPTCTATPDCASLGYTEASCPNGGVKCPWGDKWFCATSESEVCSKYGFKYTCTGAGYAGGVGESCEGKYISCKCAEGYVLKNNACLKETVKFGQCNGNGRNCSLGDILFSDGTCSSNKVSGKTPIAVVVYKSSDGKCGQAMALDSISDNSFCQTYTGIDTCYDNSTGVAYPYPCYSTIDLCQDLVTGGTFSANTLASKDYASCENSENIRAQGDETPFPAVWAAYNYTTAGTKAGNWCLPAAGIFTSIYNNQSVINTGFSRAGGTQFTSSTYAWSSTEYDEYDAWYSNFSSSYGLGYDYKKNTRYAVRPVIEF